jgi:L-rhamnose-H+ transport protein
MQVILGVIFHFIGGFASGSFYIPYKKVKGWHWESFWIVGGLFSWLIVPPLAAWLTVPGFADMIRGSSASTLCYTYMFGLLWGIGGLTYGLGVRYLGVSLGSSIILGLCMVFGAMIPSIYYDFSPVEGKDTFSMMISSGWGLTVLAGLLVCIIGIIICGRAGTMKERQLVLSACFNFGLEAGAPLSKVANDAWTAANPGEGEFLYRNNVIYVVLLWGGLTTNFIWCMILNARNKTFGDYTNKKTPLLSNYTFAALAGTTWFLQFFFYGMGESKLGNGPSSWILHMAFIILVANMWGLVLKEWKGVDKRTIRTITIGIITIMLAVLLVGLGNNMHEKLKKEKTTAYVSRNNKI